MTANAQRKPLPEAPAQTKIGLCCCCKQATGTIEWSIKQVPGCYGLSATFIGYWCEVCFDGEVLGIGGAK